MQPLNQDLHSTLIIIMQKTASASITFHGEN